MVVGALGASATALAQSILPAAPVEVAAPAQVQAVPAGTPIRVMVLTEVSSSTAKPGYRFKLRVDEPVFVDGKPIVPVGTIAWGEIVSTEHNGAVGKAGKLTARLLYLDLPQGHQPIRGEVADKGDGNSAGVVLAVVGFGIFGLLTGGDSARLKAGDLLTAYADKLP